MIVNKNEFYNNPYYFFLKKKGENRVLYFSVANSLNEARKNDDTIEFHKNKEKEVRDYIKSIFSKGKKKKTQDIKSELEELVNIDGNVMNSKLPMSARKLTTKTLDQAIAAARQTNDTLYRNKFGGYFREEDMSKAFGYEETKDLPPKQTVKKLKKMGVDNPVSRAKEMGKDPKLDKKKKKGTDMRIRLQEKDKIEEVQKKKMFKVLEDILTKKKNEDGEITKKSEKVSNILKKNMKVLKKQAEKEGMTLSELIKMLKSE